MNLPRRALSATLEATAALTAALAVTYLVVACRSLPSVLGPVPGDPHPRTRLGAVLLLVAVLLAAGGLILARRPRRDR